MERPLRSDGTTGQKDRFELHWNLIMKYVIAIILLLASARSAIAQWSVADFWQLTASAGPSVTNGSFGPVIIGDLDGDGVDDFTAAFVGAASVQIDARSGATGLPIWSVANLPWCDGLTRIGDVTGDGLDDIAALSAAPSLIPCPNYCVPLSNYVGSITVYSSASGALIYSVPIPARSLSPLGDVDGDGRSDYVAAVHPAAPTFMPSIVIVSGLSGAILQTLAATGKDAVAVGDSNGDGFREIVAAATSVAGNVQILTIYDGFPCAPVGTITLSGLNAGIVDSLTALGDIDGDGVSDLGGIRNDQSQNRAFVLSMGPRVMRYDYSLARRIRSLGDLDGDGFADFMIITTGSPAPSGQAPVPATARFVNGATGCVEFIEALAGPGEINAARIGGLLGPNAAFLFSDPNTAAMPSSIRRRFLIAAPPSSAAPTLSAVIARGNMGIAYGGPYATLYVNGSAGGRAHRVAVPRNAPLTIALNGSPTLLGAPGRFAIFGVAYDPGMTDPFSVAGIGSMVFTPSVYLPADLSRFLLAESFTGSSIGLFPAVPGPYAFVLPGGVPFPMTLALQAVAEEGVNDFAVSNAVILDIP